MATGGQNDVGWNLIHVRTFKLENPNEKPYYNSIVICQNKIIVLDRKDDKVKIHRLHDGKLLHMLDSDSRPRNICLKNATTICVLHKYGLIEMASIKSENVSPVFTRMKSFLLDGVLDYCVSVVRVNDNIVVVGVKQDTTYWCIVSLDDGHVDTIHRICKKSRWSYVTTKDNIIYISCYADDVNDTGVYAFDILNPSQYKYKYKHQRLYSPTSIVINEDGNIFVGNYYDSCIHQLTASCQLVAIFTQEIPLNLHAMLWDNGRLYVTCCGSHDITVFRHVYQGSHTESEVLVSDERKLPGIEESAIFISQGNVDNGQSGVETERTPSGPSPEGSEDEKQGKNTDSEVPFSNEGKQLVIEGTSTQIGQEIPIEQSVEEELNQAGIKMSTEQRDLFIKFQNEIGTDIYFSKGPHRLIHGQETLKATETFIEQSRPDMKEKWLEYKSQGKLTPELIDVIYAKERIPELHDKKDEILEHMEDLNIIVKARSFDENGVKEDNYYFAPCMLRPESSREFVAPEQDPRLLSTSVLCWVFTETFLPDAIFYKLLAACLARWPVAKMKDTSKHLISLGSAVFELDLTHRLTLNFKNHFIFATVTWSVLDDINTPDAKLCTRVRMFISRKLSKTTNSLKHNLNYDLCVQSQEQHVSEDSMIRFSPFQIWFEDEIHDPESPITPEHMNHARLCIALATVCGKAVREMLLETFPVPYRDIYQTILGNYAKLTGIGYKKDKQNKQDKQIKRLNKEQAKLVFPDNCDQKAGTVETFDLSLLYTLIRSVSTVQAPITGWGIDPQPKDTSLGASVERIRIYRNHIIGHSPDEKISHQDFKNYWKKFEDVLYDIEVATDRKVYSKELERQNRQVISIFDAC